uniref:Uncharacterized protein n=1 Tax=Avena sativa TaxID=4498 RepID=A0ACD5UJQ5_AVESA
MDNTSAEELPLVMPLDLLRGITNDFSEERELGSGSYGKVYMGVYPDGEKIAVKKLYDMPGLDDKQFLNEFKTLTRLRNQNIVRLVGYCRDIQDVHVMYEGKLVIAERTHRVLCLEYMSNGSLDKYLSDECDRYDWHTGYRIIKGVCEGLKYLHNGLKTPIYHLDLKPANILLDENMVPRIADFRISRLFSDEQTRATISSLGTLGYSPPEFIRNNLVSNKFDIFSLGVVIIKIMAGRVGYFKSAEMSSQEFTNLVQENWTSRLVETANRRNAYSEQVKICITIGLSCVQEDRHKRPTIQDIVYRLEETETECTYAAMKDLLLISMVTKSKRVDWVSGLQVRDELGRLQIIKNNDLEELQELGSRTFGTVYHGIWGGSDVAIKRISDKMPNDFWNEASNLAYLHHPNVVAFYGVVLDVPEGSIATVTEYMVNGSLRTALLKNSKCLDRRKRLIIAMDTAFGMEYLHNKNLVHFSLKSDNLLVDLRDPQRPVCKLKGMASMDGARTFEWK